MWHLIKFFLLIFLLIFLLLFLSCSPCSLFPYPLPVGVRWFPSAAGLDRYLHARQDPHSQDISHSDLQSSFVAESARECCHGSLSGEGGVTTPIL